MQIEKSPGAPLRVLFFTLALIFKVCPVTHAQKPIGDLMVIQVVDGDTIVLENGERVRYIGVDTPEIGTPFSEAAARANNRLVGGKIVRIEPGRPARDRYQRLRAYVWVGDLLVNAEMIRQGYSITSGPVSPRHRKSFLDSQEEAFREGRGIWFERAMNPALKIAQIHADAKGDDRKNLNDEYIVFKNTGFAPLDLTGWNLADAANHTYLFPNFILQPHRTVTIHTGIGKNTEDRLYWGSRKPVWNNDGDTIILKDADGNVVLVHTY